MEPLKELLNENFISSYIEVISPILKVPEKTIFKAFPTKSKWQKLELKERTHFCAKIFYEFSHQDYSLKMEQLNTVSHHFTGLQGVIFPTVIELFGINHQKESLSTLKKITKYSTGEFAIRPFIKKYDSTWDYLYEWMNDEDEHVRRLSSEGCRPLLPWGQRLNDLVRNPNPILPILEKLKTDSSEYVRKSVANNINDISKNHPEKVLKMVRGWSPDNQKELRVIEHGLRTLLKSGNQQAYPIIGYQSINNIDIQLQTEKHNVELGGIQNFTINITNHSNKEQPLFLNLIIYYHRNNKTPLRKVFFLKRLNIKSQKSVVINKNIAFKNLSTRKHYKGVHKATLQINGNEYSETIFNLVES